MYDNDYVKSPGWIVGTVAGFCVTAFIVCTTALVGCGKPPVETSKPGACSRPADVVISDEQLKIASGQIGKASVGGVDLKVDSEVVKLLSEGDRSALIVDYLVCSAIERGELKVSETGRVDYVRNLMLFVVTTHPSSDQLAAWQQQHRPPDPPAGKLEMPDFMLRDGHTVFELQAASPVKTFRLLNVGAAPLDAWLAQYPQDKLLFSPGPGKFTLSPGDPAITIELGVLYGTTFDDPLVFQVASSVDSPHQIDIKVLNAKALRASYEKLAGEAAKNIETQANSQSSVAELAGATVAKRQLAAASLLAQATQQAVQAALPSAQKRTVLALTGSLLQGMNWPKSAVVAYRQARAADPSSAAALDAPLARALVLANESPDPDLHDPDLDSVPNSQVEPNKLDRRWTITMASNNPLATPTNQAIAEQMSDALSKNPAFKPFADSLRGDLALSAGRTEIAKHVYDNCWMSTNSISCVLRKSEAQIAAKQPSDALKTLKDITKRTPSPATNQVQEVAIAAATDTGLTI